MIRIVNINKTEYNHLQEVLYQFKLDNGLQVYLVPKEGYQETYATITTFFGAIHHAPLVNGKVINFPFGIAHFLEHKMFEKNSEKDLLHLFTELGAESNAYTSHKKTTYLFSTTSNVQNNLELLQRLVFEAYFSEESLAKEVDIINQEIVMYLDEPDYTLYQGILASLYPDSSLAVDIAGSKESISKITVEDLYQNFEIFYKPSNMALVIVGKIDVDEIVNYLENNQYSVPKQQDMNLPSVATVIEKKAVLSSQSDYSDVAYPKLAVGFRPNMKMLVEEVISTKLTLLVWLEMIFGETSHLYQQWYEEGRFTLSLNYELEFEPEFQFLIVSLETLEPIAMTNRIKNVINSYKESNDFNEQRLAQVKKEWIGSYFRQLDHLESFSSNFTDNLSSITTLNYLDFPKIIDSISIEEIEKVVDLFIQDVDITDYTIFPKKGKKD